MIYMLQDLIGVFSWGFIFGFVATFCFLLWLDSKIKKGGNNDKK